MKKKLLVRKKCNKFQGQGPCNLFFLVGGQEIWTVSIERQTYVWKYGWWHNMRKNAQICKYEGEGTIEKFVSMF